MSPTVTSVEEQDRSFERSEFSHQSFYRSDETPPIIFAQTPGFGATKRIDPRANREHLERLLERFASCGLPGQEQVAAYLTHQYRQNRRPGTLGANSTAIKLFLEFISKEGKSHLEEITRRSLEGFVEQGLDWRLPDNSTHGLLHEKVGLFQESLEATRLYQKYFKLSWEVKGNVSGSSAVATLVSPHALHRKRS